MASDETLDAVEAFCRTTDAVAWSGIPTGGAEVEWQGEEIDVFLSAIAPLQPRVVYVSPFDDEVAVSVEGVLHVFGRREFADEDLEESDEGGVRFRFTSGYGGDRLSAELRDLAEVIANDPVYDDFEPDEALERHAGHISGEEFDALRYEVSHRFREGPGRALDREASKLARSLLTHPDFDPLMLYTREGFGFLDLSLLDRDPRLRGRVQRAISRLAQSKGLIDSAQREVEAMAAGILDEMTQQDRDRLGFASRIIARDAIAAPYLDAVPAIRRPHVSAALKRLEQAQFGAAREARFATAARILMSRRLPVSSVSTALQLSPSVLQRLISTHDDVALDESDYLRDLLA